MATETHMIVLVLDWMREHRRGTAPQIAQAIRREAGLVNASLRKYEANGHVRRVGEEPSTNGGRPTVVYELVNNEEEVPEMATQNGTTAEPVGPSAEELAAANAEDDLMADDVEELLSGYCGQVTLCEADSRVLLFVLRMRRVQDRLREAAA